MLFQIVNILGASLDGSLSVGFEFAKRSFRERYQDGLPVWALLASGSCGGVRYLASLSSLNLRRDRSHIGYLATH